MNMSNSFTPLVIALGLLIFDSQAQAQTPNHPVEYRGTGYDSGYTRAQKELRTLEQPQPVLIPKTTKNNPDFENLQAERLFDPTLPAWPPSHLWLRVAGGVAIGLALVVRK